MMYVFGNALRVAIHHDRSDEEASRLTMKIEEEDQVVR
jgi:hypothetical protein